MRLSAGANDTNFREPESHQPLITEQSEPPVDDSSYRRFPNEPSISISLLYNQTNLRSPGNSPLLKVQPKPECKFKKMEFAVQILKKLFGFFSLHFKLSSKDVLSQWKIDTLI